MKELLLKSHTEWAGLVLRVTAGLIMLPHGLQKLFGVFGGYGFRATMDYFINTLKLPVIIAFLVIFIESIGAIGLIAGFVSRIWAALFILVMIGAIYTTNLQHGLFMNWNGQQAGEGYEYHLLMIGICVGVLLIGSGRYSVDSRL
jgi:putative oxidoreductase